MPLPTRRKVFDLVGESATNPDGRRRQDILCEVEPGDDVRLEREPSNPHDRNAIAVSVGGETIGYIAREEAAILAPQLDAGRPNEAIVHCIRGGVPGAPHYGCRISIAWDGAAPHPFQALDGAQLRSRAGKLAVRGKARNVSGRFERSGAGCALVFACLVSGALVAFY